MSATTADHPRHHSAADLFDLAEAGLLPPALESTALDLDDADVRRLTLAATLLATTLAIAGLALALSAG